MCAYLLLVREREHNRPHLYAHWICRTVNSLKKESIVYHSTNGEIRFVWHYPFRMPFFEPNKNRIFLMSAIRWELMMPHMCLHPLACTYRIILVDKTHTHTKKQNIFIEWVQSERIQITVVQHFRQFRQRAEQHRNAREFQTSDSNYSFSFSFIPVNNVVYALQCASHSIFLLLNI